MRIKAKKIRYDRDGKGYSTDMITIRDYTLEGGNLLINMWLDSRKDKWEIYYDMTLISKLPEVNV